MKEFVEDFKVDLEELMMKWYQELEELTNDTLYSMNFFDDVEANYELLQKAMIEVLQEKLAGLFEDEESN